MQKRVAAIHDISGIGRCSLTVALPILSCAGIETCVMPTAVLSTHTGGFTGYHYNDLTDTMPKTLAHWNSLNYPFDAVYSGYLGSIAQADIVCDFIDQFKTQNNHIIVDPVMGDNGCLYSMYTDEMVKEMGHLCRKADIILPNLTETALLLGIPYPKEAISEESLRHILGLMTEVYTEKVVITGVQLDSGSYGAACFDRSTHSFSMITIPHVKGFFSGTGDIFGSVFTAACVYGVPLGESARLAADFVLDSINATPPTAHQRFGVHFEEVLYKLANTFKKYHCSK